MRKLDLKYLYSAAAAAAITAAAIAIPAWGDSGGGDGQRTQAQRAPLPMPPPAGGAAFFARGKAGAPNRQQLDEMGDCLRKNGVDAPGAPTKGGGFSIQIPPPEARSAMKKASKECGLPAPPPRGQLMPMSKKQREQAQKAMKSMSQCMRSKGQKLPAPPPLSPGQLSR